MSENIAQTVQKAIQDLVAPDVRELKVLTAGLQKQLGQLQKQMDWRFEAANERIDDRYKAQKDQSDAHFKALMASLGEFKAQTELLSLRVLASVSKRLAVVESQPRAAYLTATSGVTENPGRNA